MGCDMHTSECPHHFNVDVVVVWMAAQGSAEGTPGEYCRKSLSTPLMQPPSCTYQYQKLHNITNYSLHSASQRISVGTVTGANSTPLFSTAAEGLSHSPFLWQRPSRQPQNPQTLETPRVVLTLVFLMQYLTYCKESIQEQTQQQCTHAATLGLIPRGDLPTPTTLPATHGAIAVPMPLLTNLATRHCGHCGLCICLTSHAR